MEVLNNYSKALSEHLEIAVAKKEPLQLYEPIRYILALGGKRIRPLVTLMICDFFGKDFKKALPAALAVELFHNFSLIHDDIMDQAPLRRGQRTVHEKWDVNTAILSGDAMLILAYRFFEEYEPDVFKELARLFSQTAIQVCEGQQLDMDFEIRDDVTIEEYLTMIDQKTAVLLGAAMKMGAIVAGAPKKDQEKIYEFGRNLGIAFQLQDDYLDIFGNPQTFGKRLGGDIIANKKTILYILALAQENRTRAEELEHLFSIYPKDPADKIAAVKKNYVDSGAAQAARNEIGEYSDQAFGILEKIDLSASQKERLRDFGRDLMQRKM